jgi:hypothetical protein
MAIGTAKIATARPLCHQKKRVHNQQTQH